MKLTLRPTALAMVVATVQLVVQSVHDMLNIG